MRETNLDCCVVRDLLPSYLEELTETETSAMVREHIEHCAACRQLEEDMRRQVPRPLRKFCVSVFRQNQEYHIINVHDWGLFPLATAFPGGWDGMRAGTA